ncbi:MAG: WecB/TagA/CpsF family glycosyltransferase [Verrucomicrobiota bacterium]
MGSKRTSRKILGTSVDCVTYASVLDRITGFAKARRPAAVSACNTHLVALARSDEGFHSVLQRFDLIAPDGYPLIWSLNLQGAGLRDRVYGPYLMRYTLEHTPAPWRHFFFGGTPDCLNRLVRAATDMQPNILIAGTLSPPFRAWIEKDEAEFACAIEESRADFIWVALGGERQEKWIVNNLHRHRTGVFFAIGDAFELLAGSRPFAPSWMQRLGLTWLYRLAHEPRRLWARYLKFNSLFLYYSARDAILGTPRRFSDSGQISGRPRIAFLGSRGVPARYSGFEVVVENLGSRLVERGYPVTVYNRYPRYDLPSKSYKGMRVVLLPTIATKSLDTIVHTALSALHALIKGYDIIYLCGVGNAIIGGFLRLLGFKVIINVDGADFNRAKWGSMGRTWLRTSERWAMKFAHKVIADNSEIVSRYRREYGAEPLLLSYGAIIREEPVTCGELAKWNLAPRGYILFVSRLTPENHADLLLRAFSRYRGPLRLVVCGGADYEKVHYSTLRSLADDRVIFTGPRYGDSYIELSQNAAFYVMPADIEATRLVLLDQLGMGAAILYLDCAATREVVGDAAEPFRAEEPEKSLTEKLTYLSENPARCEELRCLALRRAKENFHWNLVVDRYEQLFEELGVPTVAEKN